MSGILILGSGGHAKVIADIFMCQGITVRGYLDDNPDSWGYLRLGLPVLGAIERYHDFEPDGMIVAIGSNRIRKAIVERLGALADPLWINAIHPSAVIASSVHIGRGTAVMARAVINPDTTLGRHVIVNTSSSIDHDCSIADFVHTAPGSHVAGVVTIGEGALMGIGSVAIPTMSIGAWAVVGAGAAVVRPVPDGVIAKGVPTRW